MESIRKQPEQIYQQPVASYRRQQMVTPEMLANPKRGDASTRDMLRKIIEHL